MLDVQCAEYLANVRAFADSLGEEARKDLEEGLSYLETYRGGTCVCELYADSPHSFYFVLLGPAKTDGTRERWFNGGLVYHQPHSNGVGAPEFAVTLSPKATHNWQVHT